jgi:hypothetical protein
MPELEALHRGCTETLRPGPQSAAERSANMPHLIPSVREANLGAHIEAEQVRGAGATFLPPSWPGLQRASSMSDISIARLEPDATLFRTSPTEHSSAGPREENRHDGSEKELQYGSSREMGRGVGHRRCSSEALSGIVMTGLAPRDRTSWGEAPGRSRAYALPIRHIRASSAPSKMFARASSAPSKTFEALSGKSVYNLLTQEEKENGAPPSLSGPQSTKASCLTAQRRTMCLILWVTVWLFMVPCLRVCTHTHTHTTYKYEYARSRAHRESE